MRRRIALFVAAAVVVLVPSAAWADPHVDVAAAASSATASPSPTPAPASDVPPVPEPAASTATRDALIVLGFTILVMIGLFALIRTGMKATGSEDD